MSNAHKGHARHYKHIGWYIQTAALPVKTGIVILLWLCFLIQVIFAIHFSACVYVYIYVFLHVASCSIVCENRYCHSALGGRAAPLFLFRLNTYAGTCMSIEHIYMRPQGSRGIYRVTLWTPHGLAIR